MATLLLMTATEAVKSPLSHVSGLIQLDMKVARLKRTNDYGGYTTKNHHPGIHQPFDVSLCGQDLVGDAHLGWDAAKVIEGRITCPDCLRIIKECQTLVRGRDFK